MRNKLFLLWQSFLDKVGITDPWVQLTITMLLPWIGGLAAIVILGVWLVQS